MKLPPFFKQTNNNRLNLIISSALILAFVIKLINVTLLNTTVFTLDSYSYSEFLINFQGGFVRRGLLGEMLFRLYNRHNFYVQLALFCSCYFIYLCTIVFYIYKFKNRNLCWWLLFSPLLLCFPMYIVRKDYLLYAILIIIIYLLRNKTHLINKAIALTLVVLSLFLHEAFIFWGFPIFMLILLSDKKNRALNYIFSIIPLCVFFILCVYKGNLSTSHLIVDSWNSVIPSSPLSYTFDNSIGAIGWDSKTTFLSHLKLNVGDGGIGIVITPLIALTIYYFFSNFFSFLSSGESYKNLQKINLSISLLYSSSLIFLLPMFTVLSCDVGRVFHYAAIATFTPFLILPYDTIISLYPKSYIKKISQINQSIINFIPPSRGLMIVLLLILGVSSSGFSLGQNWFQSILGTLWFGFVESMKFLSHIIL